MRSARLAIGIYAATIALAACGARTGLPVGAGGGDAGTAPAADAGAPEAGPPEAGPPDAAPPEAGPPDASTEDPCLSATPLVLGQPVSGTTCDAKNPPGSSCYPQPTAFYSFVLPPGSELPLHLSGNLNWGVLCSCPEGASCCVGPGGDTGPDGVDTDLVNSGATPHTGVLEISRSDGACGDYTVSLGP